ncbi:MAG: hypothetical protein FJ241_00220 [Nitrospira sp.]|nr:hypothetical protein [Nitrospira sp.]
MNYKNLTIILFSIVGWLLLLPIPYSYAFSDKGQDCSKCHTLSNDEASVLLKDMANNLKVMDIKSSPIKGLWEVYIEISGKKGLTYIDYSKQHLITGAIFAIRTKRNLSQERLSEINKIDISQIPLDDAILMGDKDASKKVIVFSDPY